MIACLRMNQDTIVTVPTQQSDERYTYRRWPGGDDEVGDIRGHISAEDRPAEPIYSLASVSQRIDYEKYRR